MAEYDTHPENTVYNGYFGNWGNYPWLPSGNIISGDMQNGLFMLKLDNMAGTHAPADQLAVQVAPNPAHEWLGIRLQTRDAGSWTWRLLNAAGQCVSQGAVERLNETTLPLAGMPQGLYFVEIRDNEGKSAVKKVVVE